MSKSNDFRNAVPEPSESNAVTWERWRQLLLTCLDVGFGTIWRVREDVWREKIPRYNSDRKWHPGVSLRQSPVVSPFEQVPLLHGTSGTSGPVVVRGITREKGPSYPTSFGHILTPCPVAVQEWLTVVSKRNYEQGVGTLFRVKRVTVNWDKSRLSSDERKDLENFWRKARNRFLQGRSK